MVELKVITPWEYYRLQTEAHMDGRICGRDLIGLEEVKRQFKETFLDDRGFWNKDDHRYDITQPIYRDYLRIFHADDEDDHFEVESEFVVRTKDGRFLPDTIYQDILAPMFLIAERDSELPPFVDHNLNDLGMHFLACREEKYTAYISSLSDFMGRFLHEYCGHEYDDGTYLIDGEPISSDLLIGLEKKYTGAKFEYVKESLGERRHGLRDLMEVSWHHSELGYLDFAQLARGEEFEDLYGYEEEDKALADWVVKVYGEGVEQWGENNKYPMLAMVIKEGNGCMRYEVEHPCCKYDELAPAVIRYGINKVNNENLMSLAMAAYDAYNSFVLSYEAGTRDILDKVAFYIHIDARARVVDLWGGKSKWGRDKFKEEFMRLLPEDMEEEE